MSDNRIAHGWNAFEKKNPKNVVPLYMDNVYPYSGFGSYGLGSRRGDRARLTPTNERTIISSMYMRIANDVAAIPIKHVRLDQNERYLETIDSGLNECLSVEANLDQTGRELIFDTVITMFDEGVAAIVPIDTKVSPVSVGKNLADNILTMRVGKVVDWKSDQVQVDLYNDRTGLHETVWVKKEWICIIENPFYAIMNEPNSTLKRLVDKMNKLDKIDNMSSSGKLNMIIQFPFALRSEKKKEQAEKRRTELETQMNDSKYGIGYIDTTEHVTQLNRPLDNKLVEQVNELTKTLHSQLGVTESVFDGTADEKTMLNYNNTTLEPVISAITNEMIRKFLTKTARTQKQSILAIPDPFRLVPVSEIAEIADKFTRNEITSSNEMRSVMGFRPVDDPRADELRNRNLNASDEQLQNPVTVNR